jgi:hypothetical protein
MPKGNHSKDIGLGSGKGDADRSPGWRKQYETIQWPHMIHGAITRGNKTTKKYGNKS